MHLCPHSLSLNLTCVTPHIPSCLPPHPTPAAHHPPPGTIREPGHPSDFSSHPLQSANTSSRVCRSSHPSPTQCHLRPRFCGNLPNDLHDAGQSTPVPSTSSFLSSNLRKSPISANPSALRIGFEIKVKFVIRVRVRVRG